MRTVICILLALSSGCLSAPNEYKSDVPLQGPVNSLINNTINKIISELNDPLVLNDISMNSSTALLNGTLSVFKPTVSGIKKLVASYIDVDIWSMALNMTIEIPELSANFKYIADMLLETLVPVYGKGLINANFEGIEVHVTGKANIGPHIHVQNVIVYLSMRNAVFNLNGLLNNPELSALFSAALNDNFVVFLNNYPKVVSRIISPLVEVALNKILGGDSDIIRFDPEEFFEQYQSIRQQESNRLPEVNSAEQ